MVLTDLTFQTLASLGVIAASAMLLLVIAVIDIKRFVIPNWANAAMLGLGILFGLIHAMTFPWVMSFLLLVVVFLVGALCFQFGLFGGGDVKLLAVLSFWSGPEHLMGFLVYTALAGGALSVIYLVKLWWHKRNSRTVVGALNDMATQVIVTSGSVVSGGQSLKNVVSRAALKEPVPYGVAIAVGGVYVFLSIVVN